MVATNFLEASKIDFEIVNQQLVIVSLLFVFNFSRDFFYMLDGLPDVKTAASDP